MENRELILECALELFSHRGYDAVGVQEIAEKAGITKPTLYHYFGNKRGLLESVLKENYLKLETALLKAADYRRDLPLTLHRVVSAYFSHAANHPVFYRMYISMIYSPPESESFKAAMPVLQRQLEMLEQLFIKAAGDHGNMRGRHKPYAVSLLAMVNTYIQMCYSNHIQLNNETTFKAIHQFMHGIFS